MEPWQKVELEWNAYDGDFTDLRSGAKVILFRVKGKIQGRPVSMKFSGDMSGWQGLMGLKGKLQDAVIVAILGSEEQRIIKFVN